MTSIIIPANNKMIEVRDCLKSIHENTEDFEIIMIVDAKCPHIELYSGFGKVLKTKEKFNFSHRVNLGFKKAKGDYLCILNSDVIVEKDWLKKAIEDEQDIGPGLVGIRCQRGGGANPDAHGNGPAKYTQFTLNMYGLVMSRRTYEIIGDLDQGFVFYGGEDDDYSLRALRHGLKLIVSRGKLKHEVGTSFDPVTVQQLLPKTKEVFKAKWGVEMPIPPAQSWFDGDRIGLTKPLISVVIPTRNHKDYLLGCLQSVFSQSYENIQVIVGVDGEDQPEVFKMLKELGDILKQDPDLYMVLPQVSRLLVLKTNDPVGSCDMRNRCIEFSAGEFIALQDSDDVMLENRIEDQLALFQDPGMDVVYSDYILQEKDHERVVQVGPVSESKLLEYRCFVPGGTFMMRKRSAKLEKFDEKYYRAFDFEYALRTIHKFKYGYLPKTTLVYNRHDGEHLSGNKDSAKMHKEIIKKYMSDKEVQKKLKDLGYL